MMVAVVTVTSFCVLSSLDCRAQKWSLGTNLVGWADLATINAEVGVSVSQHFTINANVRYNPWIFNRDDVTKEFANNKRGVSLGFRWWPWYSHSGWWAGLDAQFQEYRYFGILGCKPESGYALGGVFGAGYTLMLHKHLNIDFGIRGWLGAKRYTIYELPEGGREVESGSKFFILPDDIRVSLIYVF